MIQTRTKIAQVILMASVKYVAMGEMLSELWWRILFLSQRQIRIEEAGAPNRLERRSENNRGEDTD